MPTSLSPAPASGFFVTRQDVKPHVHGRSTATTHDHATLLLYTRGRAVMEQRTRLSLTPGDVLLVPAGERHHLLSSEQAGVWCVGLYPVALTLSDAGALLDPFERVRGGASAVVRIPSARQEHLVRLFSELHDEVSAKDRPLGERVSTSLLTLILAEVTRARDWSHGEARPPLVAQALGYIERHCLEPISLRDVAAAVGRTPAHVTTTLKRSTGRSAVEWIISGRVADARRRLLHTDERVDIISERVGYADPTHFIRVFRRAEGMTPAAWRRRHRP
ncbi:AraC family transcriptional regulator [Citreicoccus inhibens]|uniref:AraC family transcriptional regulator n=1 Tax=Citreicoccus inhibens TaxID=2849499 RepID=UPI0026D78570|nr:AraC family transcriptional regulator [Citreicoccus inhibens]